MKKFLAVAVSIATLVMSTAAFAAEINADKDVANLTATEKAEFSSAEGQLTVVVVPADFDGSAEDIYYINQDAVTGMLEIVDGMGLKAELEDGDYEVRVGGTDALFASGYKAYSFTVSTTPQGKTYLYGDVDESGDLSFDDAQEILNWDVGDDSNFDNYEETDWIYEAADVDESGDVSFDDAQEILNWDVGDDSNFDNHEEGWSFTWPLAD